MRQQRSPGRGDAERTFETGHVNEALVDALASAAGEDPLNIAPIYESVDPDALEALFRTGSGERTLRFEHDGYRVEIDGGGTIHVTPGDH